MVSKQQILITGAYRSGTEYITQLMNNHPDLSASMYLVNFMRFCYERYNPINLKENYYKLIFDSAERMRIRWGKNLDVHKILDICDSYETITYGAMYDILMTELLLNEKVSSWAEKTQLVWTKIPSFLEMFPNGKTVHIIRDPRSVLASFKKFTFSPPPAYLGAIFNCLGSMQAALEHQLSFGPERHHIIRFEDVISDPENTLINLFSFLGLSHDHDLLSQNNWLDVSGSPWTHNSAFAKQGSFDRNTAIERWKSNLDLWEITFCETVNNKMMAAFNYDATYSIPDWPEILRHVIPDKQLSKFLQLWLENDQGVEAFPTDSLKPENWNENI